MTSSKATKYQGNGYQNDGPNHRNDNIQPDVESAALWNATNFFPVVRNNVKMNDKKLWKKKTIVIIK